MGVVKTGQIAVMVLNWNGRVWLRPCLDALLRQSGVAFDPWLIDNGSRDGSLDLVREQFPDVRTYGIADNLGFGAAYNRAIAAIRSPWIALLNNDTVVQPGWLAALAGELSEHPEAAAVGSKLLYLDRPEVVNHAGGRLTTLGAAYDVGLGQLDGPGFDKPDITGCATGAASIGAAGIGLAEGAGSGATAVVFPLIVLVVRPVRSEVFCSNLPCRCFNAVDARSFSTRF